jgi:hypothetical protein
MAINDRGGAAIMTRRRNFLIGIASLIAAPAVVGAEALMPIAVWRPTFGFILHGGGMGSWVTCKKSELVGVDLVALGLPQGHDWQGRSDTWYWRPTQAPLQWEQATHELQAVRRNAGLGDISTNRHIRASRLASPPAVQRAA